MNIIIPIGGIGQRFKDEGYELPKPLINVLGKPMLYRVIKNLNLSKTDTVYITYHNHLKNYNFETLIKFYFSDLNIKFISLDYLTKGASETVLNCLNTFTEEELKENILLLDCDTFYEDDIISKYKQSDNKNLIFYFKDTNLTPLFSYINIKDDKISDIKEKIKISDNANTGAYGFENGLVLKQYCKQILDLEKELYISCVYDKMLQDNYIINACKVDNFSCVGTPLQLKIYCDQNKDKAEPLRVCFDLDNTLVTHPTVKGDYSSVLPIQKNIDYLNFLKKLGHTIIIYTARRMRTHSGNVGAIIADVGRVTFDTLERFNIPYDEIYFGKPYANFYIDDLAVNANASIDNFTGMYNTNTTPRHFHQIEYNNKLVTKHTSNSGEVYWYKNIPEGVKEYFPKVFKIEKNKIVLEHIKGVNYSYLHYNKILDKSDINELFNVLQKIHNSATPDCSLKVYENYTNKLNTRKIENKSLYQKYDPDDVIFNKLTQGFSEYINNNKAVIKVIHGDPVFTNILKTENEIKFIDMRGKIGEVNTIFGDVYYDYAKLYQSLIGYDFILNDIEIDNYYIDYLVYHFEKYFTEEELSDVKLITASLLYTLIPLHIEDEDKFNKYFKLIKSLL